jgi:hypothetical protein
LKRKSANPIAIAFDDRRRNLFSVPTTPDSRVINIFPHLKAGDFQGR